MPLTTLGQETRWAYVGFRAHVKIASRIVSYRIPQRRRAHTRRDDHWQLQGLLGTHETVSRSVQPFLQRPPVCPTHRQTDHDTCAVRSNGPRRVYATHHVTRFIAIVNRSRASAAAISTGGCVKLHSKRLKQVKYSLKQLIESSEMDVYEFLRRYWSKAPLSCKPPAKNWHSSHQCLYGMT